MHPFFSPLNEQCTMTLLTLLSFEGEAGLSKLNFLDSQQAALMKKKALDLKAINETHRLSFISKEMRELLLLGEQSNLEWIDNSWIFERLKGEHPLTVGVILLALPTQKAKQIFKMLPSGIAKLLPQKQQLQQIPRCIRLLIRQQFESQFGTIPQHEVTKLTFKSLFQLGEKDLNFVLRDQGLIELGQAFASVGKMALAELCRKLSHVVVNFSTKPEAFFFESGLWRVSRAFLLEPEATQRAFEEHLPKSIGLRFQHYRAQAQSLLEPQPEVLKHLQDSILMRIQVLSSARKIAAHWSNMQIVLHDEKND
jgi:hypothetical protein